jgi:hypothetical protein
VEPVLIGLCLLLLVGGVRHGRSRPPGVTLDRRGLTLPAAGEGREEPSTQSKEMCDDRARDPRRR